MNRNVNWTSRSIVPTVRFDVPELDDYDEDEIDDIFDSFGD